MSYSEIILNELNSPINVAVFPCGSEVASEVYRSLRCSRHHHLIGLSSIEDYGRILFEDYIGDLPMVDEFNFITEMQNIIESRNIRFLIPGMDEVGYFLKKNEMTLGCEVVYANFPTAEIIRKKSSTYETLGSDVRVPQVFQVAKISESDYPIFTKPDIGYGSKGARVLFGPECHGLHKKVNDANRIFTEYLPGEEYTIDCFSDMQNKLLFAGARARRRIRMGISVSTEIVDLAGVDEFASKVSHSLKMSGAWFFQVKRAVNNELSLLEVASRVSGSMALYRLCGVNFILMDLFQRSGLSVNAAKLSIRKATLERAFDVNLVTNLEYSVMYVDFDDCLIIEGKVNTDLVKLIFQCINNGVEMKLITRYKGDIEKKLIHFRLDQLFDEIIHIKDKKICKSSFIKEKDAVFIDDSFAERTKVNNFTGIAVFGPDAVEGLLKKNEI